MRTRQVRYSQIVMLGVRHTRREREQLKDWDVRRAKTKLMGFARNYGELPVLPHQPIGHSLYRRAEHHSPTMVFPRDVLEDVLPAPAAYRQVGRILFCT